MVEAMVQSRQVMRSAAWTSVILVGLACSRGSLQGDAGGTGRIGIDAGPDPAASDGSHPPQGDGPVGVIDAQVPTADANCGITSVAGGLVPAEMLLVLDRSIAGDQSAWRKVQSAIVDQINASGPTIDWGLYVFPKDGAACGAATVTGGADLGFGLSSPSHLVAHVAGAGVDGNGTPTAAAIGAGADYLRTLMDPSPKFMMLATDGAPTCAGTAGALFDDAAQAQTDAIAAIDAARVAGFPTVVVGPSTTADVGALNALARAGGYARLADDRAFFTESTLAELFGPPPVGSCVIALQSTPPAPDTVAVLLNGAKVPRDPSRADGWEYTDGLHTAIELHGAWCAQLAASRSFEITVYYGCLSLIDYSP
jgi:hypothetical protein